MTARTINELPSARRATVRVCDGARADEHVGQGLLLELPGEGIVVLTCHHVIESVEPEHLYIRRDAGDDRLGPRIRAEVDAPASDFGADAAVLRVDLEERLVNPYLHELDWRTYDGSLDATGLIWFGAVDNFSAGVRTAARFLEVQVRHPPNEYVLPVAFRLSEPSNVQEGISGGVVLCRQGVLGLVHFAQRQNPAQAREAYLNPLSAWVAGLPELADLVEPFFEPELREKADVVKASKLSPRSGVLEISGAYREQVYLQRDVDEVTEEKLREKRAVLVVGRRLSGKTRLACELLQRHADALVVLPRNFGPPPDLGERSSFRGREVVLLFENLHKHPGVKPFDWLERFDGVGELTLLLGTSRNADDFDAVKDREGLLMDFIGHECVYLSGDEGDDLTDFEGLQLAERLELSEEEFRQRFDGTPGSLLVEREPEPEPGPELPDGAGLGVAVLDRTGPSETAVPNNIPTLSAPFVGRKGETLQIVELLDRIPAVTLCGPDGRGKTRLAMHVAEQLLGRYREGVWWVELSTYTEPALVAPAVAGVLGHPENAASGAFERLSEELADARALIVLNGVDDVAPACADLIEGLHAACPRLSFLCTGREPLGTPAEQAFEVPRLDLDSDAVQLFLAHALERAPGLDVEASREQIDAIVHSLNGNPLALGLAAVCLDDEPLEHLAGQLAETSMPSPDEHPRAAAVARVDATVERALDALDDIEATLFAQLGAFAGSFGLEAVAAVAGVERTAAPESVRELVDQSLLLIDGRTEEPRFRMLDSVRRRAIRRLDSMPDASAVRRRHATWYAELAEHARKGLTGKHASHWLRQLELEADNCRAALTWSIREREVQAGLRLGAALWWQWYHRGRLREGRTWLEQLLAIAPDDAEAVTDPALGDALAEVLNGAGNFAFNETDYEAAEEWHRRCLAVRTHLGDEAPRAGSLNNLGLVARRRCQYELAEPLFLEAIAISRRSGNALWEAMHLNNLGNMHRERGLDPDAARDLQEESVMVFTRIDSDWGLGMAFCDLGYVLLDHGELEAAESYLRRSLEIRERIGNAQGFGESLNGVARLERALGQLEQAEQKNRKALWTFNDIGDRLRVAESLEALAAVAVAGNGRELRAARLFGAASEVREHSGAVLPPVMRREHRDSIRALEQRLGKDAYARESQVGRMMSLHEAMEQA